MSPPAQNALRVSWLAVKIVARMFDVDVADVDAPAERAAAEEGVDVDVKVGSISFRNLTISRSSELRAAGLLS